jgi:protease-4
MKTFSRVLILLCLALLPACSPTTISITLFADSAKLLETTVEADKNYGDNKVVIIDVRGLISEKQDAGIFSSGASSVDELACRLKRAELDPEVKAVIIRINSPGGTVTASDMMYREVRRFEEETKKPVIASLGEVAASGGYYLALSADRIIAEPTSLTGSIGVIIPTINFSDGLARIGIHSRSVKSGKNKDLGNPLEPEREEHYAVLQATVDEFYARFKGLVVERRSRAAEEGTTSLDQALLDDLTDGRIITGTRAAEVGLVDQTGGIRDCFKVVKSLAKIPAARLVKYYPEGGERPRSAYAQTTQPAPGETEINLLQIRGDAMRPLGAAGLSGAYYLWLPG